MLLLIFSFLFLHFSKSYLSEPPKKINKFEVFRTKKSMSSQKNWDQAQLLLGHFFKTISTFLLFIGSVICLSEIIVFFFWRTGIIWLLLLECLIFFICCIYLKYSVDSKLE